MSGSLSSKAENNLAGSSGDTSLTILANPKNLPKGRRENGEKSMRRIISKA